MNQPTEVHVKVVDHDSIEVDWRGVSTGIEEEPLQGYMVSFDIELAPLPTLIFGRSISVLSVAFKFF